MKIKSKLVALFCALLFFSCSKDDATSSKVASVLSINDSAEQKVEYSLLNSNEKFIIWDNKINSLLEDNSLNEEQKDLIKELKNNIKPKYFEKSTNDEKEYFKNIYVKNYLKKIDKVFNRDQINSIFYSINIKRGNIQNAISDTSRYSPRITCDCNRGSLFGCGDSCTITICGNPTPDGCGFMWGWECNGGCILLN
jgi:hypothetical protein